MEDMEGWEVEVVMVTNQTRTRGTTSSQVSASQCLVRPQRDRAGDMMVGCAVLSSLLMTNLVLREPLQPAEGEEQEGGQA